MLWHIRCGWQEMSVSANSCSSMAISLPCLNWRVLNAAYTLNDEHSSKYSPQYDMGWTTFFWPELHLIYRKLPRILEACLVLQMMALERHPSLCPLSECLEGGKSLLTSSEYIYLPHLRTNVVEKWTFCCLIAAGQFYYEHARVTKQRMYMTCGLLTPYLR